MPLQLIRDTEYIPKMMERFVLRAALPILPLGAHQGDVLVVTPGGPVPAVLYRPKTRRSRELYPNYGLFLLLAENGSLTPAREADASFFDAAPLLLAAG